MFENVNAVVIGVSPDSVKQQAKFRQKYDLPFILLADVDHQLAELYGVWNEHSLFGKKFWGNDRTTFLIDPAGKVARIFPNVKPAEHSGQVLAALAELQ